MTDPSMIALGIAGVSLTVTILREVIVATRTNTKETEGTKVLIATAASQLREEFRMEHDEELRRNGESAAALRTKITEVELWVRDNCVRIPHFSDTVAGLKRDIEILGNRMEAMGTRMDSGLQRIEEKLDKQLSRH